MRVGDIMASRNSIYISELGDRTSEVVVLDRDNGDSTMHVVRALLRGHGLGFTEGEWRSEWEHENSRPNRIGWLFRVDYQGEELTSVFRREVACHPRQLRRGQWMFPAVEEQ